VELDAASRTYLEEPYRPIQFQGHARPVEWAEALGWPGLPTLLLGMSCRSSPWADGGQRTLAVTGAILDVKDGEGEIGAAAAQVLGAARDVAQHSTGLGRKVAAFLSDVRTA